MTKSASFKYDPAIGLGDLADLSFSGTFSLEISLDLAFTLGYDLNPLNTPTLNTSLTLPPPSSGRLRRG